MADVRRLLVAAPALGGHGSIEPGAALVFLDAGGSERASIAWTFEPSVEFGSPSIGADGTLYAATVSQAPSGSCAVVAIGD